MSQLWKIDPVTIEDAAAHGLTEGDRVVAIFGQPVSVDRFTEFAPDPFEAAGDE